MKKRFSILLLLFIIIILTAVSSIPLLAQTAGTNWTGQFFNTPDLTGAAVSTVAYPNGLNFNWGVGRPRDANNAEIGTVNADNFSARFSSTQNFAQAGAYTFRVLVNEGVRVSVNNQIILNNFTDLADSGSGFYATYTATVQLPAGNFPVVVEYYDRDFEAILQVAWVFGGGQVGPTATPVPAATGQVVRVRGLSLRTGPYLGASFIRAAVPGTGYPLLARNTDEGVFTWYKITVGDSTGWVSGRYFQPTGNLDAIPIEGSVFDTIDGNPSRGVVGVTRAIMNFRRRPSERATLIGKIPWGGEVDVIGRTIQGGKNHWLQVRYNGQVGWIFAPFIGLRGIIDAVPIY